MGTIKTTNIEPIADNGTVTLGGSGDTFTVPSGVTVNMSNATQTGVGGANTPAFRGYLSSNQTVSDASSNKVTIDTEEYDTDNAFASSRFTVPSGKGGKYFFGFQMWSFDANAGASNYAQIFLKKNGTSLEPTVIRKYGAFTNHNLSFANTAVLDLAAGDYVEFWSYIDYTSSTFTIKANNTSFTGFKLI